MEIGEHNQHDSWGKRNPDRMRVLKARWREANREKERQRQRKVAKEVCRAKKAANMKRWRAKNVAKRNADSAQRRASKLAAMPSWADASVIASIYAEARTLSVRHGIAYHVDHVIPLKGKTVCGLHVENNLQILRSEANLAKGNQLNAN